MDRNGEEWTGDQVEAEAHGEGAPAAGSGNRADSAASGKEQAPSQRSVDTAAKESVRLNDDGDARTTTAGSSSAGEAD